MKKSLKKIKNKEEAITLVALVVTIVVLLILAGITIVYVFGDNGVFGKAEQAKVQTELGKIEEQAGTIYADKFLKKQTGEINEISNSDIIEELKNRGNQIEIRNVGAGSITGISLEPASVSMDKDTTKRIKVKIEGPADGNLYYAVVDGKYYEISFQNSQLKIEREATTPEGSTTEQANIEVETGYNTTFITNVQINQNEKTIEITSGAEYGETTLNIKYGSKTAECKVKVEEAESNWAEIAEIAKEIAKNDSITSDSSEATVTVNGENKTIKVGEIYKVKYNGEMRRVRVLGFKHDELVNTGAYGAGTTATKAGISFEFYDLMTGNTGRPMNSTNINENGWANTQMRKELNGYTTSELEQGVAIGGEGAKLSNSKYIKQVKKQYIKIYNDASSNNQYANDYLWLLACSEIVNSGISSGCHGYAVTSEGSQYKYYQGVTEAWNASSSNRQKYNASGSADYWWLRSPSYNYSSHFCLVYSDGNVNDYNASYSRGVAPGFAI